MSQYRGSPLGIKLIITLYNTFGYKTAKALVYVVALFYALISHKKRQEMQSYYEAVGVPPTFGSYFKNVYAFSLTIFDRFISNQTIQNDIAITRINLQAFEALHKTGGLMIFSHHGNWAQSFKIFQTYDITLHIIIDEAIDESLQEIENHQNRHINLISLKSGMQAMLEIARALQNREVIIIMVDRVKEKSKSVTVEFLGKETLLHSGGFEIAMIRKVPIIGCDVVRIGDQEISITFSDLIRSQADDKKESIQEIAQAYARFLETQVQQQPWQWFNFFDFWKVAKE